MKAEGGLVDEPWWRTAITYQIYPRSFADANGDGIGDINGVRSRLPYLQRLGVDAIWLSPFYPSPQADAGYDVSDYRDVDPVFGSLDDAAALITEAHEHGLRVLFDLVPNHTSDQHPWFQAALAAGPGSPERARYLFRPGRGEHGDEPPNNWLSNFGGPAWTRVPDGSWYLHLFAPEQPDLDWTNAEVVAEFEDILRFWLDLGVDGIRIDVAHGLAKDPDLRDLPDGPMPELLTADHTGEHPHWDRDEVHDVYRGWRAIADRYEGDRCFVAETWVPNFARFALYLRPDELHTAFNFAFLKSDWDAARLRTVIDETLTSLEPVRAVPTWVLSNHDVERHTTRLADGDPARGLRRALAETLLMLALPGGSYLYQGEELGLDEVLDLPDEVRQDPIFFRTAGVRVGRDGCRVPIPWSGSAPPFGFSTTPDTWLPQPPAWAALTVEAQEADPHSTLAAYQAALRVRRETFVAAGPLRWVAAAAPLLAFTRGRFACVTNTGTEPVDLPADLVAATTILSSAPSPAGRVAGDTTAWLSF